MRRLALLGPQRLRPTLASVAGQMGVEGRVATITAGWRGLEEEDEELSTHLGGETVNLRLHRRAEEVLAADTRLAAACARRDSRLRQLRELYRLRLDHAMASARTLLGHRGDADLVAAETEGAFAAVRALDQEHLERVRTVHAEVEGMVTGGRPALRKQVGELRALLDDCGGLAIAGGHVALLLDRLRLFDVVGLAADKPILAWSAGAMALAELVVLFHDRPPQGYGNAEVLDSGLGLYPRFVPLPHARRRLSLDDPQRVEALARRLAPRVGLPLDEGEYLLLEGGSPISSAGVRRLSLDGFVRPLEAVVA